MSLPITPVNHRVSESFVDIIHGYLRSNTPSRAVVGSRFHFFKAPQIIGDGRVPTLTLDPLFSLVLHGCTIRVVGVRISIPQDLEAVFVHLWEEVTRVGNPVGEDFHQGKVSQYGVLKGL